MLVLVGGGVAGLLGSLDSVSAAVADSLGVADSVDSVAVAWDEFGALEARAGAVASGALVPAGIRVSVGGGT